jgi:adenine-specific DNA methylase
VGSRYPKKVIPPAGDYTVSLSGGDLTLTVPEHVVQGSDDTKYTSLPFISTDDVDLDKLETEFKKVVADVRSDLRQYYTTVDPDSGKEEEIQYVFQSQRLPCPTCDESVNLFKNYKLGAYKSTSPAAVYCPNTDCSDRVISLDREIKDIETCPECGTEFDPNNGNYGRGKYTCGKHKHDVKETLQRLDERPTFDTYALKFKTSEGDEKFKMPDDGDKATLDQVKEEYDRLKDDLPIPDQKIPQGDKTKALLNYNYEHFYELFTPRHRLTHGKLFKRAMEVEDQNISEFIITAISNTLMMNSLLCVWDPRRQYGGDVFKRHAYIPRVEPVEANPINERGGRTSVQNFFNRVYKAKKYCDEPFEKVKNANTGDTEDIVIQNERVAEERREALRCKTSERMEEDDESVDYVITDPPYYDNVQYSELSDFFYVWLREALKGTYSEFEPELVPKAREIVSNKQANKDEEFFVNALTNVFAECHRVLKDDGELIFTYHHNENEAWSVILEAIIESGFTIGGAYPVQSEKGNSTHIEDLDNAEYDILLFGNKVR